MTTITTLKGRYSTTDGAQNAADGFWLQAARRAVRAGRPFGEDDLPEYVVERFDDTLHLPFGVVRRDREKETR